MYIISRNVLFILSFSLAYAGYFMHVLVDKEIKTPMKKYEEVTIGDYDLGSDFTSCDC